MSSVPVLVRLSIVDIVAASRVLYEQCDMENIWHSRTEALYACSSIEELANLLVEIGLPDQIANSGRDIEDFLPEFALTMEEPSKVKDLRPEIYLPNVIRADKPIDDLYWETYAEKYDGDRLYPLPDPQWLAYMGDNELLQIFPAHSKNDVSILTREDMIGKLFWCGTSGWCTIIGPRDSLSGAETVEQVFEEIKNNYGAHEC
tara:strand:+ start:123 stop:731 length:609 start_codon:yes stop_codon:yes gene_type:complete